jgi:hypothetical protein
MIKQAKILGFYSGGPREGWNKEDDYKHRNMRLGSTGTRLFSSPPPPAAHECMRDKGYTVNVSGWPARATPGRPVPVPVWDTGL